MTLGGFQPKEPLKIPEPEKGTQVHPEEKNTPPAASPEPLTYFWDDENRSDDSGDLSSTDEKSLNETPKTPEAFSAIKRKAGRPRKEK